MNLKAQKAIYGTVIVFLLIVIGTSVYALLGGFEKVVLSYNEGERLSILGRHFEGYYAHPELEELWIQSKKLIKNGEIPGQLAVVNYANDSLDNDEVEQFIGVAIQGGMAEVPADFEVLEMEMSQKVTVYLPMHPFVRPRPHKVEQMLADFAEANGYELANYTVELHHEDNSMILEAPIVSIK